MVATWPEPIVSVQALSQTGLSTVPNRYVKPVHQRPVYNSDQSDLDMEVPVLDMRDVWKKPEGLKRVRNACEEWGFFQVVNHGVDYALMESVRGAWREFFDLPVEMKRKYANSPDTYEGYGSRIGVVKDAKLDWSDYFFLNYLPSSIRNPSKWPSQPPKIRKLIEEYGEEVRKLCERLVETLSESLGLEPNHLMKAFGGEDKVGANLRANFYPKCPQPHLTLGLSSHSDPGGITIVLPDEKVAGLQVRRGDCWVTVKSVPNALIVNIGDQVQILSNGIYKSVEHQVVVNSGMDRVSLALFYNPRSDIPIGPVKELLTEDRPALYKPIRFDEYRLLIRQKGPSGKNQVDSLLAST
ncbi:2-oxoglutarate (2OG) and Fe(II)-dependent oxygenase superfamily protein [Raphanus sativus]|uniref:Jasmonate-induced oxygenase 4 n=1 Tax=Raphanus sativus TaxID=3726 RepID=A0A6J0NDR0_RAPSA|nr:jasmonate-induced oxygenase 4 [Raphanus sativus]KAJ4903848.1 2-oxoglutarate (2OG) and Fe(II)-dependent oxygenase superfamily protein [Raphanus sativus]